MTTETAMKQDADVRFALAQEAGWWQQARKAKTEAERHDCVSWARYHRAAAKKILSSK